MRRLRFSAALISVLQNEFGPAAVARRELARARQMNDPSLGLPLIAVLIGPENVPAETFTDSVRERLLAPV
jgi:hypothetical protein